MDAPRELPMKAVMLEVPPELLEDRRRRGVDRRDEMWDGVLHMVPSATNPHQDLEGALEAWLRHWWVPRTQGRVYHQSNVSPRDAPDWRKNYRIPDLVLITPERFAIDVDTHCAGGPDVVVEIRTPGDETDEKRPFYREVGVRELWVVDRDSKAPAIFDLQAGEAMRVPGADGWIRSVLGVELRATPEGTLEIRASDVPESCTRLG